MPVLLIELRFVTAPDAFKSPWLTSEPAPSLSKVAVLIIEVSRFEKLPLLSISVAVNTPAFWLVSVPSLSMLPGVVPPTVPPSLTKVMSLSSAAVSNAPKLVIEPVLVTLVVAVTLDVSRFDKVPELVIVVAVSSASFWLVSVSELSMLPAVVPPTVPPLLTKVASLSIEAASNVPVLLIELRFVTAPDALKSPWLTSEPAPSLSKVAVLTTEVSRFEKLPLLSISVAFNTPAFWFVSVPSLSMASAAVPPTVPPSLTKER